jgi:N-acetyl-gamma-glutamyl-phosphate reductase
MVVQPPVAAPRALRTAGVAGASGYGGLELQRLLAGHPQLRATALQARSGGYDPIDADELARCDVAFLALPHGESRTLGEALEAAGTPVVDLGSDFRVDGWTYGLTELAREDVREARTVANPGCYATAAILALAPLKDAVEPDSVIVDAKSGVSGAGRTPSETTLAGSVLENHKPYSIGRHRHLLEMQMMLGFAPAFVPHLLPIRRGLLATCYVDGVAVDDARALLEAAYAGSPVVQVLPEGVVPEIERVVHTDAVELAVFADPPSGRTIVVAAEDNLGKGAAGQAMQNANLALGLSETHGLRLYGVKV